MNRVGYTFICLVLFLAGYGLAKYDTSHEKWIDDNCVKCYQVGFESRKSGMSYKNNPYLGGFLRYQERWLDGWMDADKEEKK